MDFTYTTQDSPLRLDFRERVRNAGYSHIAQDNWQYSGCLIEDKTPDASDSQSVKHKTYQCRYDLDDALLWMESLTGQAYAVAAAADPVKAESAINLAREWFKPTKSDENKISVNFWSYSTYAELRNRKLTFPSWKDIEGNYAEETRSQLNDLMTQEPAPKGGGRLILWHGPPGTGKTTALRALAREWRNHVNLHYITDLEKFFSESASYMNRVIEGAEGEEKWRLIVIEDAGELLQRDARVQMGQALTRFLNISDGLLGEGYRVLALLTTNEEVGSWHPAVTRPGRTMARVEFTPLSLEEVEAWIEDHGGRVPSGQRTIADLYASMDGREMTVEKTPMGFTG